MSIPRTSRLCNTNPVSRDDANSTVKEINARIDSAYNQHDADITMLETEVAANTADIVTNTANIATNTTNIATNTATLAAATSANTPSTLVERDASGNFAAGTITAALTGTASGNLTLASPSQHGLLLSGTANAATALAAAGTNDFLVGSSGADPAWKTPTQATALINTLTQSLAGTVASAGQLLGTNTNDNASAGNVGEVMSINRLRSNAVSLTTNTPANIATTTSITLTPGDWDIRATVGFIPAATTSITVLSAAVKATSGAAFPGSDTLAVPGSNGEFTLQLAEAANVPGANPITLTFPSYRVSVATATTLALFLVAQAIFTVSTMTCCGYLEARRVR